MTTTAKVGSTCLPRFATPRDERYPTLGPELGEVARRLGKPLMPWQQAVVDVAFEYDAVTGRLRYDEVDVTVPRQSGKTILTFAKKVHRLTVMARRLGPQRSTYIAQTRLASRKKLERDFAEMLRGTKAFQEVASSRQRPTKASGWRLTLNNGSEAIQFGTGSYLQIDAPSRTGGHGDTLDDATIDEAFAHETDEIEGALRPAMATRKDAQLWVISTAGDKRSVYLWRKVLAGRAACDSGEHGRVCYIEYSAPDDTDPGDPEVWRATMPALGHTVNEEFIAGEWERAQRKGLEGIDTFRRAYLNQWPVVPILAEDLAVDAVVQAETWAALSVGVQPMTEPVFSIEVGLDRTVYIGAAWNQGGRRHVEVVEQRPGTDWVVGRMAELTRKYSSPAVVIDGNTEAASLQEALENTGACIRVMKLSGADRIAACGLLQENAASGLLSHAGDPALAAAVAAASWRDAGDGGRVFSRRKSARPIGELYAVTQALYGLANQAAPVDFFVI